MLPSLEVAGPGGHWVEVSRAVGAEGRAADATTRAAMEAYDEYYEAAQRAMRAARPATTCTAPSRRASPTAATTSAT